MNFYYFSFFIGIFFSYCGLFFFLPFLKRNLLDIPNSRSSHLKPIPRGGGLIFVFVGTIGALFFDYKLPLFCLPLSILGLVDDKKNLPRSFRYIAQLITSTLLIIYISPEWLINLKENSILFFFTYFSVIFFMTAIINFVNFMDGLDGFLASCMLIIFAYISFTINPSIFPLCGALLGFLLWNWHPAKVFMGDVGSVFLGSLFAGLLFDAKASANFWNLFLISSPLIFDATHTVIRRFLIGQNVFKAHKLHLYQRLNQAGWNHSQVTLLYSIAILVLSLTNILFGLRFQFLISILFILCGYFINKIFAYPFKEIN